MSDITTESKKRTRTVWQIAELEILRTEASTAAQTIAARLGRTEARVRSKAVQLGISLRQNGSKAGRRQTRNLEQN